jgi:hypothetical protein
VLKLTNPTRSLLCAPVPAVLFLFALIASAVALPSFQGTNTRT